MFYPALGLNFGLSLSLVFFIVILADSLCHPRRPAQSPLRSVAGMCVTFLAVLGLFGLALAVTGAIFTSAVLVAAIGVLLPVFSNIKNRVLGEPLVFSDFALIGAVFQHPQFYISALRVWQIVGLLAGLVAILALVVLLSSGAVAPRLGGLALAGVAAVLIEFTVRSGHWDACARQPDSHRDVAAHGLIATLLVHWLRWRKLDDPAQCSAPKVRGHPDQLVIIVQCESFTDPAELWSDPALALPGLAAARELAQQSGRLMAHGFGAYTMRTEYGVLFGRGEDQLGLRKFDPFLTARGETSFSLARRLQADAWDCHFVHPHDLRFYGRDQLMGEAGFANLIGPDAFPAPETGEGRYVSDAALADKIIELAQEATTATLIYAVSIENHGPWPAGKPGQSGTSADQYLRLLNRSDAMLMRLLQMAQQQHRPVILCCFGDHRPSIPGVSEPGGDRHTPYVIVNIGCDGKPLPAAAKGNRDVTPAQLHHLILEAIRSGEGQSQ